MGFTQSTINHSQRTAVVHRGILRAYAVNKSIPTHPHNFFHMQNNFSLRSTIIVLIIKDLFEIF